MEYTLELTHTRTLHVPSAAEFYSGFFRHLHDHFVPSHRNNYHPHLLSGRSLALLSGLLIAVKIFTIVALAMGPAAPSIASAIIPSTIVELTNQSRAEYNLPALAVSGRLAQAAEAKAKDMLAKGYFSHNTPDGKTPWDFIAASGYNYISAGENLAVNFTEAENVENAWMNSPSHKANIINRNFEEIGVGIAQGEYQGHQAVFVVQMFGTPVEQKIAVSDTPTKIRTAASAVSEHAAVAGTELAVADAQLSLDGDKAVITAKTSDNAVKVLAVFGKQAVRLDPKPGNVWAGSAELTNLSASNSTLLVEASDMAGKTAGYELEDFAPSVQAAFSSHPVPQVLGAQTQIFGITFQPKTFEYKFYLFFIATLLSSLVLAIGLKRHIQHMSLIANSSFVIILASLLYWAG